MSVEKVDEAPLVEDLTEALSLIELRGFRTYGLAARRRDGQFEDVLPPEDDAEVGAEISPADLEMAVQVQEDSERIAVRVRLELEAPLCVVEVDVAALYGKNQPFTMSQDIKPGFVESIAIMNVWPYIRQHVSDLSQRLDTVTTMGLMRPGGQVVLHAAENGEGD